VILFGLSSGHKLGLGLSAAIFIVFALASALVLPRWWPRFPGKGRRLFIAVTVLLFVGMLASVEIFGREEEEAAARGEEPGQTTTEATTTEAESTESATTEATTTEATTTAGTTTEATTATEASAQTIKVSETEFKITLPQTSLKAGKVEFDLTNEGKIGHDLAVKGPGVEESKTPVIDGGKTAKLSVKLQPGTYELYCSVPGHKQAGMDTKVTVS
jgi:uncharacterized cupredoxin-like copper-binding protein